MTTTTGGSAALEPQHPSDVPPAMLVRHEPMWFAFKLSVSATGAIIEEWRETEDIDFEQSWRQLAREARLRFAEQNPY